MRANKTKSNKTIIPKEYIKNKNLMKDIKSLLKISKNFKIQDIIYSQILQVIENKKLLYKPNIQNFLKEYENKYRKINTEIYIHYENTDYLGAIYQSLMTEGEKNIKGSYYTPKKITEEIVKDLDFNKNQTFLDMCCGSGSYILALNCKNPNLIYGIDNDEIAVMICKFNLIIKYIDIDFTPNIIKANYLTLKDSKKYDYVITNPPWGGKNDKKLVKNMNINDTFSAFLIKGYKQLKENGKLRLLVPKAILNIKSHQNIRKEILTNMNLTKIKIYKEKFTGVITEYVNMEFLKDVKTDEVIIDNKGKKFNITKDIYMNDKDNIFSIITETEHNIIKKIEKNGVFTLKNSIFALGIVTGNNNNKILDKEKENTEKIYTGKEIEKYILKDSNKYIEYKRNEFQQVAPDEYYRQNEKLVYKFINKNLVFAYDDNKRIFLNSANILIPNIQDMSTKVVLAILNSNIINFYYKKRFDEIKVLKNNLIQIPIPQLKNEEKKFIEKEINEIITNKKSDETLQEYLYNLYDFTKEEIYLLKTLDK